MTEPKFLKFGPEAAYVGTRSNAYIRLADSMRTQLGSDFLVGEEHSTLASFQAEVEEIREDLRKALQQARDWFAARQSIRALPD